MSQITLHARASRACFWFIGRDNTTQEPAAAVDIHAENGDVLHSTTVPLTRASNLGLDVQARRGAEAYAASKGVPSSRVSFDSDSSDCFARD